MLHIDGYSLNEELRCDRKDTANGIGGGLLVYSKNCITIKALDNNNEFNQFCQFEALSHDSNHPLNVTLIYRSPNSNETNTDHLCELIESVPANR